MSETKDVSIRIELDGRTAEKIVVASLKSHLKRLGDVMDDEEMAAFKAVLAFYVSTAIP